MEPEHTNDAGPNWCKQSLYYSPARLTNQPGRPLAAIHWTALPASSLRFGYEIDH